MAASTPERRREIARLGGLKRAAMYDGREVTAKARSSFFESFLTGHECRVCPTTILPVDLSDDERQRRAKALHAAHYSRIRLRKLELRNG